MSESAKPDRFEAEAVDALESKFRQSTQRLTKVAPELKERSLDGARYNIGRYIVFSYVLFLFCTGAFIMYRGAAESVANLIDIMKTLFLPVVTFVIGHYYGSKSD
jgi:hypothetical protein